MSRAALLLGKAVAAALGGDAALARKLGAPGRVLDRMPKGGMPFLLLGPIDSRDYSTATEPGEEHRLTLEIWTGADHPALASEIAAAARAALDALAPDLGAGVTLCSLAHEATRARRVPAARALVTAITFRAVTEDGPAHP